MLRISSLFPLVVILSLTSVLMAQQTAFETIDPASQQILARDPVTDNAEVKHILIGWADLASTRGSQADPRAAARSREQADQLATALLLQVRAGDPIERLMAQYSEDPGSASTGESYTATPEAGLVPPFKELSLRLQVGEAGLVMTNYGWHIILRIR
ncbi:MAG: peptidylprolyl isomerase [Bradymonadales bacterium]|nr:peptidylprolyl isomerase [Bradymonadales bacterium]